MSPGEILEAELAQPGRSKRWLAIRLAGAGASDEQIQAQRRYLQKAAGNPTWRPTLRKAQEIATALEIAPELLLQPRAPRTDGRAGAVEARLRELVELGEQVASRLERLLDESEERRGA